jgi:IS66 C-terminal element
MYSLIVSAKMNDVDPPAWLADVLARIDAFCAAYSPSWGTWQGGNAPNCIDGKKL